VCCGYGNVTSLGNGINFRIVFQCRVKPNKIRFAKKSSDIYPGNVEWDNDYWVLDE
jgi:hypothetical protein